MKLSVFSPVLAHLSLDDALSFLHGLGVEQMELGCGGFPGTAHADINALVKDNAQVKKINDAFARNEMTVSALSVHGNVVHPDKAIAKKATDELKAAIRTAHALGTDRVVTFSGCPGDKTSSCPNWITCPWPNDYSELLDWQWNEVLIPYWKEIAALADKEGVKVALEMHPGFMVYGVESMLRLHNAAGKAIGANLDPSHLLWQGVDITEAIKALGNAIYFFHAKDTALDNANVAVNGVLDTKSYADVLRRSWVFRTVGYGNGDFKKMISALAAVGYDGPVSIEHEDSLMTPQEGLTKAILYLKEILINESNFTKAWWI